jgi:hypothetical protein
MKQLIFYSDGNIVGRLTSLIHITFDLINGVTSHFIGYHIGYKNLIDITFDFIYVIMSYGRHQLSSSYSLKQHPPSRRLWTFPWFEFGNRRRSAVFDGIWARLLRWKARESGIKKKFLIKRY